VNFIEGSDQYSPEEKRAQIDAIHQRMKALAKQADIMLKLTGQP
jgi:hypothetical protein